MDAPDTKVGVGTKYVVFTTNRSGSTWMMSTLSRIPGVTAQGELFLPRPRARARRWDSDFARPRFIEVCQTRRSVRLFAVFAYLNDLYRTPGTVGFKLMYAQLGRYPEILAYLIRHRVRVVHLVRRNHLDVLISYAVKAKLGQAHLLAGESAPRELCVELDTDGLISRLEWLQRKQDLARALLKWSRLPHLEVAYEDLLADHSHFCAVFQFLSLDVDGKHLPDSTLVKIRQGGHRDVIQNYEQVRQTLAGSRFAGLLQ